MMRPVILSMPANSATGLVMRSEAAGATGVCAAASAAAQVARAAAVAASAAIEIRLNMLMQGYRWLRPGDSLAPKASRRFQISKQLNANCGDKGPISTGMAGYEPGVQAS